MRVELEPVSDLSAAEVQALDDLRLAVYPPEVAAAAPARGYTWAPPSWRALVWDAAGALVSTSGALTRTALVDGSPTTIGGLASVKTHPTLEGRGYGAAGVRRATAFLTDDLGAAFLLLVCREPVVLFYERLGWHVFDGTLLVEQPGGRIRFTVIPTMVHAGTKPAPRDGVIDLRGLPW